MIFQVSTEWKNSYPGAAAGILAIRNAANPDRSALLEVRKVALENDLRTRYSGWDRSDLAALPVLQAYNAYYKQFKKTYHVQLQLESVILKGKAIRSSAALVEAMFIAELKNLLLTAGHDLEKINPPVRLDIAQGNEVYILLRGQEQVLKPGDMWMADQEGILSSVLYGPDQRTQITTSTRDVLFTVYAPPGVGREPVYNHLLDIQENVRSVTPGAETELLEVYGTG